MNIIAIDPGPEDSAYVVMRGGALVERGKIQNPLLRNMLNSLAYVDTYDRGSLVIEMIACYGMAVGAEVFETCVWIGRFIEAWGGEEGQDWHRLTRQQIKQHLCHSQRAKDANIRQALIDRLGPPGKKKNPGPTFGIVGDCWSALAVAVTFADLSKQPKAPAQMLMGGDE